MTNCVSRSSLGCELTKRRPPAAFSAGAGELFRYRVQTEDGRQFEYVFEASAQASSRSITREEAIRIATDWMATFHHLQLGSIENAEFRDKRLPHWLVCFADTANGPIRNLLFAVVLADGRIVQPTVFREALNASA
jgi:hypothetical protein